MGWRKGSEIDEELWPTEAFGGVSDEQFWDDLAADKPLATTARTAQSGSAATRRRPDARGTLPDTGGTLPDARGILPEPRVGDDRGRADARRGAGEGTGPYPQATQPYPAAAQPSSDATRPVRAAHQPAESRGSAARISPEEDPLTSPAYSLRSKASTADRSYPSPRRVTHLSPDQYQAAILQETQAFSLAEAQAAAGYAAARADRRPDPLRTDPLRPDGYRADAYRADGRPDPLRSDGSWLGAPGSADTVVTPPYQQGPGSSEAYRGAAAYPYAAPAYGAPEPASMPPHDETYPYRSPVSPASPLGPLGPLGPGPARDARRPNGGREYGHPGAQGAADRTWGARPAYPPASGYQSPYGPRGNHRR